MLVKVVTCPYGLRHFTLIHSSSDSTHVYSKHVLILTTPENSATSKHTQNQHAFIIEYTGFISFDIKLFSIYLFKPQMKEINNKLLNHNRLKFMLTR